MYCHVLVALFAATACAVPDALVEKRQAAPFCSTFSSRVSSASQASEVTAYCSSFLGVPAVTTTTTVTPDGSTITVTPTTVSTLVVTSTTTVTPTRTISGCQDPFATPGAQRRAVDTDLDVAFDADILAARAVKKPTVLSSYKGTALTSACSCLSIPTGTTTITTRAPKPARATITAAAVVSTKRKTRTITATADETVTEYSMPEPTLFKLIARFAPEGINGGRLGALRQADNGYDEVPPWTVWNKDYYEGLTFTLADDGFGNKHLEAVGPEQYALQFADDESFSIPDIIYFANGDNYPQGGTYLSTFVYYYDVDHTCGLGLRNEVTGDALLVICDYGDSSGNWYAKLIPPRVPPGDRCDYFSIYIISL